MLFHQIKHRGDNFSYIIADETTKNAAVVDPAFNAEEIIRVLSRQNLTVKYVMNTHQHTDHTMGNEDIRTKYKAKVVAHKLSKVKKDIAVVDGDIITMDEITIKMIHTPGHTPDSICLLVHENLLTGDTLFVGECGRTDLPEGNAEDMYHSLFYKILKLDDEIRIYPGHDYGPHVYSTVGREKKTNYCLKKRTLDEFMQFMAKP